MADDDYQWPITPEDEYVESERDPGQLVWIVISTGYRQPYYGKGCRFPSAVFHPSLAPYPTADHDNRLRKLVEHTAVYEDYESALSAKQLIETEDPDIFTKELGTELAVHPFVIRAMKRKGAIEK